MNAQPSRSTDLLRQLQELPPLPQTLLHVWQLVDKPTTSQPELARAISLDPALAAGVLKVANSAHYGRAKAVTSVPEAILLLGFAEVKRICMCSVVKVGLLSANTEPAGFDRTLFWRHCLA